MDFPQAFEFMESQAFASLEKAIGSQDLVLTNWAISLYDHLTKELGRLFESNAKPLVSS